MKGKCQKVAFRTKAEGRRAIGDMATKWSFVYKHIYWCAKCRAYHITSKPRLGGGKRKKW